MKPLSLFIIALLFAHSSAYGQAVNADTLCHLDSLPSIHFEGKSTRLNKDAKNRLDYVVRQLQQFVNDGVYVSLYDSISCAHPTNLGWDRTIVVCDYLARKKIDRDRIIFGSDVSVKNIDIVSIRPLSEKEWRLRKLPTNNSHLKDSDGDGIIDQFDLEPHTPHNAEVDTHGRTVDTDGDGVPDYKDKEKLTQTECFPVNKDGIGVCPEPSCCSPDYIIQGIIDVCKLPYIPPVIFSNSSPQLTKEATRLLDSAAGILRNFPNCSVEIIPYYSVLEGGSRLQLQLCWDEVYTIISYLEKAGIGKSRLSFGVSQAGNTNSVVLSASIEARRYLLPPYPPLSQIKNLPLREVEVEYRSSQQLQH